MNNPFILIIIFSLLIICSYLFTQLSKVSKIPSVLFLIGTGIAAQYTLKFLEIDLPLLDSPLRLLGLIGLMMIVLEGALDIKVSKTKLKMIFTAICTSSLILGLTTSLIAWILFIFNIGLNFMDAFFYAIPFSVVSSAIVIPSVHSLNKTKREFMILESTLSDIFGIILFEFWVLEPVNGNSAFGAMSLNVGISIVISIVLSYLLIILFNKIKTEIKFFLFLSILALLFAIGEYLHYSALLIILIFGLFLNNTKTFFLGKLKGLINNKNIDGIKNEFVLITNETSFLIRTFFFVVFGLTMDLEGLFTLENIIIAGCIMAVIYAVRIVNLKVFLKSTIFPQMLIAPRGLVTVLLFNRILEEGNVIPFNEGIVALVIIGTNIMMMIGLISSGSDEDDILRINMNDGSSTKLKFNEDLNELSSTETS